MSRRVRGFTLIEILVTLTITMLLMTMILGVLVNVISSAKRSEQLNATQKVGHAIINLIQRDVEAMYLPPGARQQGNERAYFYVEDKGDIDRIDFITAVQSLPDEDNRRSPITEVGYRPVDNTVISEKGLYYLFRREDLFEDDAMPLAGGRFIEVYDRLTKFNITCFDGEEWRDSWDWSEMKKKLPMAVKVEIKLSIDREAASEHLTEAELDRIERESVFNTIITLPMGEKIETQESP